jgi:hypothetical protein
MTTGRHPVRSRTGDLIDATALQRAGSGMPFRPNTLKSANPVSEIGCQPPDHPCGTPERSASGKTTKREKPRPHRLPGLLRVPGGPFRNSSCSTRTFPQITDLSMRSYVGLPTRHRLILTLSPGAVEVNTTTALSM